MAGCWLNPLQYVKEVAKCIVTEALWPPVKRHIDYWWCFDGNVQGLRDEICRLEREMSNRNQKIEEARLRAEIPTTDVQNWSNEGSQKLEEATRILQGCDDLKLWNVIQRYSVGKSAKETAEDISKLREEGNSIRIADPAPPAAMVPISHAPTLEFQSRKSMEEDIIKSLKDGNVRMIAICGPGGVGKTTMVRRIEDRVRKEFDEVVTVVVSHQTDQTKIQNQIEEILRLGLSEKTLEGRAHILRTRLMDSKKKLIIFDDVWKSFEPEDIGVPYRGCKIILTSRLKDVCEEMEADKVIEVQVLDKKEAWTLFREKSGDRVDDLYLRPIAEEVAARSLVQLRSLEILSCRTIEQVLWNEMESNTEASIIEFPKLKRLKLYYLPNLLAFTQGVEIIKFPQLIELEIEYCPKLRTKIDQCPTGMIERLLVRNHDTVEEIFRDDGNRHIIFQELYELDLRGLPCLTTLYGGAESIKFPKLKEFWVGNLPRLNSFVPIDLEPIHDHNSLHLFCNKKGRLFFVF